MYELEKLTDIYNFEISPIKTKIYFSRKISISKKIDTKSIIEQFSIFN